MDRATAFGAALLLAAGVFLAPNSAEGRPTGRLLFEATSGEASDTLEMVVDVENPQVTITSPPFGSVIGGGSVTFSGTVVDRPAFNAPPGPSLPVMTEVIWNVWDQAIGMPIQTGRVPLVEGRYTVPDLSLPAGEYLLEAGAMDAAGNVGFGGVVVVTDPDAPALALVSPQDGEAVLAAEVAVDLNFAAPTTIVAVNGTPDGRSFPAGFAGGVLTLPLAFGANVFTLDVESGGITFQFSFTLFRVDELGQVRIESPANGKLLNTPTVTVRGTVPRGTPLVEVNGIPATIAADGVSFEAVGVPIREGSNPLRAVAYPLGREALVTVTGDFTPPRFLVFVPEDGAATTGPQIQSAGFVSEVASIRLVGPGGEVTGVASLSSGGSASGSPLAVDFYRFELTPLPLTDGPNALLLEARDPAGNTATEMFTVVRSASALLFAAPTSPVPALRTGVTLEALEPVTLLAWYAAGRRVPAVEGGSLTTGLVPVPDIPLLPGANPMRVVYQRAGGPAEVLAFEVQSSATDVAVVEGMVTDTATGLPVAGALVQITVNGITLAVVTDAEGRYRTGVEPGAFDVTAVGEGYAAGGASGAGIGGGTAVADVPLEPTGLPGIQNQVAIVVPPDGTVTDFEQLTVVGTVLNPGSVVTVNGVAAEVVGSRFRARHVPLAMGANTLQVIATALGSPAATDVASVTRAEDPVLAVKIFSPPAGVTIPGGGLTIRGFVSVTDARVLVNGSFAPGMEGILTLEDVALPVGAQGIVALAETPDRSQHAEDRIDVRVAREEPVVSLVASPSSGYTPISGTLQAAVAVPMQIERVDFDLDGDGAMEIVDSSSGVTPFEFSAPHVHLPRVHLTTKEAVELSAASAVRVDLAPELLGEFGHGNPVDLASTDAREIAVLDGSAGTVTLYALDGAFLRRFGSAGAGPTQLSSPQGLAIAADGRFLIADTGNQRIQVYSPDGAHEREIGAGVLGRPRSVAIDGDMVVVADAGSEEIRFFSQDGTPRGTIPMARPSSVGTGPAIGVVAASLSSGLFGLVSAGALSLGDRIVGEAAPGTAIDVAAGESGLLVADANPSRVVVFDANFAYRRSVELAGLTPKAVQRGFRREVESIYVADGTKVVEIGLPVESPVPVVEMLRSRMASGDVEGAVALYHPEQRPTFRRIFELIRPGLASEAAAMGDYQVERIRDTRAVVRFRRPLTVGGVTAMASIPMYLVRPPGGTWMVYEF